MLQSKGSQRVRQDFETEQLPLHIPTATAVDTCPKKVTVVTRVQLSTHIHTCGNSESKCERFSPETKPWSIRTPRPGQHRVCVQQLLPCASSLLAWGPSSTGVDSETEARGHTLHFYSPEVPKL